MFWWILLSVAATVASQYVGLAWRRMDEIGPLGWPETVLMGFLACGTQMVALAAAMAASVEWWRGTMVFP